MSLRWVNPHRDRSLNRTRPTGSANKESVAINKPKHCSPNQSPFDRTRQSLLVVNLSGNSHSGDHCTTHASLWPLPLLATTQSGLVFWQLVSLPLVWQGLTRDWREERRGKRSLFQHLVNCKRTSISEVKLGGCRRKSDVSGEARERPLLEGLVNWNAIWSSRQDYRGLRGCSDSSPKKGEGRASAWRLCELERNMI